MLLRWSFILSLLLLALGLLIHPLVDPDVYIHLRDGRYWVESGFQVTTDPFTYTVADQPIEKVEWLFRVSLFKLWQWGGYSLLIIVKALIMTAAFFCLGLLIYRRWPNLGIVAVSLGLALLAPWTRIFPERPYVITYFFLLLVLLFLHPAPATDPADSRGPSKLIGFLPLLVIPWVNIHPGFMVIFVFLGAQWIESFVAYVSQPNPAEGRESLLLASVFLASLLAGACNPLGFNIYPWAWSTLGSQNYMHSVIEWMPPQFQEKPVFFFLFGAALLVQILTWRQARLRDLLPLIFFSFWAIKSRRNIPLFLIAALPPMISQLRLWWDNLKPKIKWNFEPKLGLIWGSILSLGLLLFLWRIGYAFRLGEFPDYYPKNGLAWLQAQPVKGRLFAPYHWGGYIGWMTQGKIKVFMDGRLPLYGKNLYQDYQQIIYGQEACLPLLDKYAVQVLLLSPKNYFKLFERLAQSGQWILVYWDHVGQVFVRWQGTNQALAQAYGYLMVDPNSTPYFNPQQLPKALAEIQRARQAAPHSYLPLFFAGDLLRRMDNLVLARIYLTSALKLSPRHAHTLYALGAIALQEQQWAQAEAWLRQALRYNTKNDFQAQARYLLALTLAQDPSRQAEALGLVYQVLRLQPNWEPAEKLMQELSVK